MKRKPDWIFILLSLFLFWRVYFLQCDNHLAPDGAMIGLMARHILQGNFPVFFYGYGYIGSLKSFLAAGLFLIFGESEKVLLLLPPLFYIGFVWSTYWLAALVGGRKAARIAMLLTLTCSFWLTLFSAEIVGGYMDTLFHGNLLLIFCHKFCEADPWKKWKWSLAIGLVGGLAFWQFPLSAYYLAAVLFSLFILRPGNLFSRHLFYVAGGFFVGSFPFWWYNWNHEFVSFSMVSPADLSGFYEHFCSFFKEFLPGILGWGFQAENMLAGGAWLLVGLLFFGALIWLIHDVNWHWHDRRAPILFLFVFVIFFFCRNNYVGARSPMVVVPLLLLFPLFVGLFLDEISRHTKIIFWGLLLLAAGLYAGETRAAMLGRQQNCRAFRAVQDHFLAAFERAGVDRVFAPYYVGPPLVFRTQEKLAVSNFKNETIPGYLNKVSATPQPAYLLPKDQGLFFKKNLAVMGYRFKEEKVENHSLYFDLLRGRRLGSPISPAGWKGATEVFDRDATTRWSSEAPQRPEQTFTVELPEEHSISGIEIDAQEAADLPLVLKVEISKNGKDWQEVCLNPFFPYPLYASGPHPFVAENSGRIEMAFPPVAGKFVKLTQKGSRSVNYWSIHELFLYEAAQNELTNEEARKNLAEFAKETPRVAEELSKFTGRPIYTDSWLSANLACRPDAAKLRFIRLPNPRVAFSSVLPPPPSLSRVIRPEENPVFAVEKNQAAEFEKSAEKENLKWAKKDFGSFALYETNPKNEAPPLVAIARDRWRAEADPFSKTAKRAIDRKLHIEWKTIAAQKAGMYFLLDLGQEEEVKELRLNMGARRWEYPRHFELLVSADKTHWEKAAIERIGVPFWDGKRILNSTLEYNVLPIRIAPTRGRYFKLVLTQDEPSSQWTLADIQLYH